MTPPHECDTTQPVQDSAVPPESVRGRVKAMASLSDKSDKEISQLLDEHGIKHGPVVDSTRKLYEKKLKEAMTKNTKPFSPDKTFYREEEEEVEYVTYHPQQQFTRHDGSGDVTRRSKVGDSNFAHDTKRSQYTDYRDDVDYTHEPIISQTRTTNQTSRPGPPVSKTSQQSASSENKSGGVPGWLRVLVFLIIAIFLYYVYSSMEPAEEGPFKTIL